MSHYTCLVILPLDHTDQTQAIDALMARYDENKDVDPYKKHITSDDLELMQEHYNTTDLPTLVTHMQEWTGRDGGIDDDGLYRLTTYNPDSKWDWFTIGGRYSNLLTEHGDIATCRTISKTEPCYALVTPDGEWHARGTMGWFGVSFDEQEEQRWRAEYYECLSGFPDNTCVLLDCHI